MKGKTSGKYWEIDTKFNIVTVRLGKIGTEGKYAFKFSDTLKQAATYSAMVTATQVTKGYRPAVSAKASPRE